jgi:hypothetical protein
LSVCEFTEGGAYLEVTARAGAAAGPYLRCGVHYGLEVAFGWTTAGVHYAQAGGAEFGRVVSGG